MTKQQLPIETISGTTLVAQNRRQRLYVTEAKTTIGIAIEHTIGTTSMNLSLKEATDLQFELTKLRDKINSINK
jgi:hypothetical protein